MIVFALVYVVGLIGLVLLIDRRFRTAQAAREAAFLRRGFGA